MSYEPCVVDTEGNCTRWSHQGGTLCGVVPVSSSTDSDLADN
jgi:hypothetical protein